MYTVRILSVIFAIFAHSASCQEQRPCFDRDHGLDLPTTLPLIVAHRGSAGALPENTLEAFEKAVLDGADTLECDIAVTFDLELVCRHEAWLSVSTDVASRPEFANRTNSYTIEVSEGVLVTITDDWFTVDFTLEELKNLGATQTNALRDSSRNGEFKIPTLDEVVRMVQASNRTVGFHIELKTPTWFNSIISGKANTTIEKMVIDKMASYGYISRPDPCIIQSFFESTMVGMLTQTDLPIVVLINSPVTDAKLQEWAERGIYGVNPSKGLIVDHFSPENGYKNYIQGISDFIERCHGFGLRVHPYTFRNEEVNLAWDYEQDPYLEMDLFCDLQVDGFITDFPASAYRYLHGSKI